MRPAMRCCGRWRIACDRRCATPTCWRGSAATSSPSSRPDATISGPASIDLARRIAKLIAEPFQLSGHRVEIGTSIGIAIAPEHGSDQEQLLKKADLALYRSKSAGRNCYTLYDEAMSAELEARNTLEGDLRDAIARCQFEVHYQPFYRDQTGDGGRLEALVRWRHPMRGLIPPDQFIPLAEETGLIVPLGEWVLRQACDDAASWPADVKVAVNLSPVQFKQAELFEVIQRALQQFRPVAGAAGDRDHRVRAAGTGAENQTFMRRLKGIGISLALDDFGTGYSSLSYLTDVPVRQDQDRQVVHPQADASSRESCRDHFLDRDARARPEHVGHRRRRRDPRAVRDAARARRQFRPGLSARPPGAAGRTRGPPPCQRRIA